MTAPQLASLIEESGRVIVYAMTRSGVMNDEQLKEFIQFCQAMALEKLPRDNWIAGNGSDYSERNLKSIRGSIASTSEVRRGLAERLEDAKRKAAEIKGSLTDGEFFDIPIEYKGAREYNYVEVGLNDEIKAMIEERERLFNQAYKQEALIRKVSLAARTREKLVEIERQIIESDAEVAGLRSGLKACDTRLTALRAMLLAGCNDGGYRMTAEAISCTVGCFDRQVEWLLNNVKVGND